MFSNLPSRAMLWLVGGLLAVMLLGAGASARWGLGVPLIGQPDHRAGSVIGPRVIGGGPGVGK